MVLFNNFRNCFDPITVGLIEAGEAGGILSKVLERIALLLEGKSKLRGQIIGALVYPVIVLVLAVTVFLVVTPVMSSFWVVLGLVSQSGVLPFKNECSFLQLPGSSKDLSSPELARIIPSYGLFLVGKFWRALSAEYLLASLLSIYLKFLMLALVLLVLRK